MKRPSYHHGNLASALTEAAIELAREGGPEAVVLREAARQVGVSATAAYRHFAGHGDLMHAVKERAAGQLEASMTTELARTPPDPDIRAEALRRLKAFGLGYLRFALAEPGLFRTAFCRPDRTSSGPEPTASPAELMAEFECSPASGQQSQGPADMNLTPVAPYRMLVESIDRLVATGVMRQERRPWAEVFAWSAVHGLAMLLLDGPLALCTPDEQDEIIERILNGVATGLAAP